METIQTNKDLTLQDVKISPERAQEIFSKESEKDNLLDVNGFKIVDDFLFYKSKSDVFYVFQGFLLNIGINANTGLVETLDPDDLDKQLNPS